MMWNQQNAVILRMEFVLLALHDSVNKTQLCREFGISRKTGYKWLKRYNESGLMGLESRSHRPKHLPNAIPGWMVTEVIRLRNLHSSWGPKKIQTLLLRAGYSSQIIPSVSSLVRILKRAGLSVAKGRGRPRKHPPTQTLTQATKANEVWTVDLKGWWRTKDGKRCEPLTIRDLFSRYLFCLKPVRKKSIDEVMPIFEDVFKKYGLPEIIRSDNGSPFVSTTSLQGLTRLSAWWVSLGIKPERIRLGHPEENGGHERMHADIAREIEKNPACTVDDEEIRLENWRREFNNVRPHEALRMLTPSQVYRTSSRFFGGLVPDFKYPPHFEQRKVKRNGAICFKGHEVYISVAFKGKVISIEEINSVTFRLWFCNLRLGDLIVSSDSSFQLDVYIPNPMKKKCN